MKITFVTILGILAGLFLSSNAAAAQQIQSMKLLTPQVGWAESGQHLHWTADGGAHWKVIDPHSSKFGITDVFFLDANLGWVLLSGGDAEEAEFELASTDDGGDDWRIAPIRLPAMAPGSMPLDGRGTVFFVDMKHGWMNLWMRSGSAFRLGVLLMTEDGGKSWKWAPDGSDAGAGNVYFVSATDGWIAGGPGDQQLYATHDGAKSWNAVALKPPPVITKEYTASYVAPMFHDREHGFLPVTYWAGDDGEAVLVLFASDDGGQTWKVDRVLPKQGYLSGQNVPATVAGSVLLTASASNSSGTLRLTAVLPGGKASTTAARVSRTGVGASQLSFTDPSRGWVSTPSSLFSTQDGGATWTNITPGIVPRTGQSTQPGNRRMIDKHQGAAHEQPLKKPAAGAIVDTYLGFDRCPSPAAADMLTWWKNSPYFDVGVYVGGASVGCAVKPSWVSTVEGYGWGIIPIWSGPQAPCACWPKYPQTCTPFPHVFDWDPATARNEGAQEADSATAAAASIGLPSSVIYLDIESYDSSKKSGTGQSCGAAAQAYLDGWVSEMHVKAFSAGVYGSSIDAQTDFSQISPPTRRRVDRRDPYYEERSLGHDLGAASFMR